MIHTVIAMGKESISPVGVNLWNLWIEFSFFFIFFVPFVSSW